MLVKKYQPVKHIARGVVKKIKEHSDHRILIGHYKELDCSMCLTWKDSQGILLWNSTLILNVWCNEFHIGCTHPGIHHPGQAPEHCGAPDGSFSPPPSRCSTHDHDSDFYHHIWVVYVLEFHGNEIKQCAPLCLASFTHQCVWKSPPRCGNVIYFCFWS